LVSSLSPEHTKAIPAGKKLESNGTLVDLGKEEDKPGEEKPGAGTLPSISGTNVDTFGVIAHNNGSSTVIHGSRVVGDVADVAREILPKLSDQAEVLRSFFASAKTSYPDLATKFAALQTSEANIENKANQTNGLSTYRGTVDAQRDAILNKLFEGNATARAEFNKYFALYTKGNYIVTRDWQTEHGAGNNPGTKPAAATTAEGAFAGLLPAAGESAYNTSGTYDKNGRGTALNIGTESDFNALMARLLTAMKAPVVTALGVTGAEATKANALAEALIIQLGQDNEEFRAFVDDLTAEGLTTALNFDYTKAGYTAVSSVGTL
jgi:hypothetical protein